MTIRDRRLWAWSGLAAALALAVSLRLLLTAHRYFDTDELVHLHAALLVSQGNIPFRDFFAHHGPLFWAALAPWVSSFQESYALAIAGRALTTLVWLWTLFLTARLRKDEDSLLAVLTAVWLAFFAAFAQKSLEVRPDGLAAALVLAAAAVSISASPHAGPLAGLLAALALWCSPKAVFPAAGILLAGAWRRRGAGPRFLLGAAGGGAACVLAGVAYFAAHGAAGALWSHYVAYNAGFPRAAVAWSRTLAPSLLMDPLIWIFGLAGLSSFRRLPEETGALASTLAGLYLCPSVYPQYLLFAAPFLARLAADRLLALTRWKPRLCVPAAAIGLVIVWGFSVADSARLLRLGNALQRERWQCADRLPPGARVWDIWSGDAFARPHAARFWFIPDDAQGTYDPAGLQKHLIDALARGETAAAVRCESCLRRFPSGVTAALERDFYPSGCGRLWLRKPLGGPTTRGFPASPGARNAGGRALR